MGGSQSRVLFRERLNRLLQESIPENDSAFWRQLLLVPGQSAPEFAFALFTPEEVRLLRDKQPSNMHALVRNTVRSVAAVVSPLAAQSPLSSEASTVLINGVRLLTRLMPFIFEQPAFAEDLFWAVPPSQTPAPAPAPSTPLDAEIQVVEPPVPPQFVEPVLAHVLLTALLRALFMPSFCNPANAPENQIWRAGIMGDLFSTAASTTTGTLDSNRTEVLKCLLACCSSHIYIQPRTTGVHARNNWLEFLCRSTAAQPHQPQCVPLLASLVNIALSYDPIGWGIPYGSMMVSDYHEPLANAALQVLLVLLDHRTADQLSSSTLGSSAASASERPVTASSVSVAQNRASDTHVFQWALSSISASRDFAFLLDGIARLLGNPLAAASTYLPASTKEIECYQELLVLLWRLLHLNPDFVQYFLESDHLLSVLVSTVFYLSESRRDQAKLGLAHVCLFVLLLLSGERKFSVKLNVPYLGDVPAGVPVFQGCHADLLVLVLHKVIVDGQPRLEVLFDCILTIVANISPYVKCFSNVTCLKLMGLFEMFVHPRFVYAREHHHQFILYLIETFNNILQYQSNENVHMIYALLRRAAVFDELAKIPTQQELDAFVRQRALTATGNLHNAAQDHQSVAPLDPGAAASSAAQATGLRSALVIIDVQNDFLPGGSLAVPQGDEVIPVINQIRQHPFALTVLSQDWHPASHTSFAANNTGTKTFDKIIQNGIEQVMWPVHCVQNTPGAEFSAQLQRADTDIVVVKGTDAEIDSYSAFFDNGKKKQTELHHTLRHNNINAVFLCGLASDFCVSFSALDAATLGYITFFVADASRGIEESGVENAIAKMRAAGIHVIQSSEIPGILQQLSAQRLPSVRVWTPTREWVSEWKSKLPLQTIARALQVLVPQVNKVCAEPTDEASVVMFLRGTTLVGVLPVPHPIVIRRYAANDQTTSWFSTYLWGVVYVRNQSPPVFYGTNVQIFSVQLQSAE
eukprot:TRINITY_DN6004_c0_g1_i1.p1 TRINITY_DN6004_c0_g1~~TRINITY_DN6004_c0_g1_i1.p1  ORF type:complete len:976 (-),score=252.71 TRINITY_DN6004_c0_g1_i1:80-3007(-)